MRLRRLSWVLLLGSLGVASAQDAAAPRYREAPWPIPAVTVAGTPAGPWNFGQVPAVATTAQGNILVFHRGAHPILEFTAAGEFVRPWGNLTISEGKVVAIAPEHRVPGGSGYTAVYGPAGCDSCGAHSVRVDSRGNVWAVDATAHVVYKMTPEGRVTMQLGTKGVAGAGRSHFNLPTDVAFAPNGDIYVSDGYGSARVVKFSSDGKYLLEWGRRGTGPGEFGLPHNVVVDVAGKVYVTDRDNRRIQVFDANGKFLSQWSDTGGVSTLFITEDQRIWTGGVLRDLNGEVVARLPGNVGGHGTTVSASGDVFIAQLGGNVQKFVRE
jgi:DNA-binding beta-propeller fold protein YncE